MDAPERTPSSTAGPGRLSVVGIGIKFALHTTQEARDRITRADKVLYLVSDRVSGGWIESLNPSAESLARFYHPGKPRVRTYEEIVEEVLAWVRKGLNVCFVLYGHPGVYAAPPHEAIRRARLEGYEAEMLPGVSAEDCLFADLGVDPGEAGWQSYEATSFLLYPRSFDTRAALVLWQVAGVGEARAATSPSRDGLRVLAERLEETYGPDHEVILYQANPYPMGKPLVLTVTLRELPEADLAPMATLYVPPKATPQPDPGMFDRLRISLEPKES